MVGALLNIKLLPMPLLSPIYLIKILMQIIVLLKPLSYSLKHVFQNSFPTIKYHCTTTKGIENIIMSFKSSDSSGYDEVPTKLLKLCSPFLSSPLNYICNRTLFTGFFPDRLQYAIRRPMFKEGNKNYLS
jgi:hypothetical protein